MISLRLFARLNLLLGVIVCYNLETSHPIIYGVPQESEKNSYFGMSVAIRPKAVSLKDAWIIQIGAPRGNVGGEAAREPGTIYRCHALGPCRAFHLDKELAAFGGRSAHEFVEKKDRAWIGVAMDVNSFGPQERSVVCGHRWVNQKLKNPENIDVTYLMTGVCYLQDLDGTSESPVRRLLPLVDKEKIYTPKPYVVDLSTYHWGLGQAGLSVKLSEASTNLLIGAPGVTHWIGSVIEYEGNFKMTVGNFAKTEIARKSRYTYLGYSVTFGRFYKDGKLWCAAGAPRSANYRGEVFTFLLKATSDEVRIQSNFVGTTFGEYFGSSLAAADVNNDGLDDLIVGAPLFSSKDPDEGRIHVYLGTERGNFMVDAQVIKGGVSQGRFGSCITSVKDLDRDGFNDVAVGAPYEDDNKGAIYVYRGYSKGLRSKYTQRIRARDLHPHLRGFGVSVSSAVDVDGNEYLDLAVGSHLSGHVVLLRSHPVISLYPKIKTENMSLIDRKESYVNVTICSRYSGSNAPSYVDIVRVLEIDPVHKRGKLASKASLEKKSIRLRSNEIFCEIRSITLNLTSENFSPLVINLKNAVDSCSSEKKRFLLIKGNNSKENGGFSKICPIGNTAEVSTEIAFAGICGLDLVCRSELELSCKAPLYRGKSYTIGSSEFFVLSIQALNHGEPAQQARIKIWSNLRLKTEDRKNEASSATSKRIYWLDVGGILTERYHTEFLFQIDLDDLAEAKEETELNLTAEIFTSSLESNYKNNNCKLSINLQSDSFLSLSASSSIVSIYIAKATTQNPTLNVTHYYEVRKDGVTPVKDAELTICIPFYLDREFLTFQIETPERMYNRGNNQDPFGKRNESSCLDRPVERENCPPTNRTLFLSCSDSKIQCKTVKIFFMKDIPPGFFSYVKIMISINVTAIDLVKNQKDIIYLSTSGILNFWKFLEKEPKQVVRSASVSFYTEESELRVDAHVIALSILGGGFLLFLIATGLAKSRFFKRAKKEELKALRNADISFVYFSSGTDVQET